MEKITIRAFRATDEPDKCDEFLREHTKVLTDLGVISVIAPDDSWTRDPNTIVFVAEHRELGMVAGIRLEKAQPELPLRMETCIRPMEPGITKILHALNQGGNAELCGLWNAHRFAGRGIPMLLIDAAIACSTQLELNSVVTFIAEYVAPYASRVGFEVIDEIGDHGQLVYPIPTIKTWAMVMNDTLCLGNIEPKVRKDLISLRVRPRQYRVEKPKGVEIFVLYDLMLNHALSRPYEEVIAFRRLFAA